MAAFVPSAFSPRISTLPSLEQSALGRGPLSPEILKVFVQEVYGPKGVAIPDGADKRPRTPAHREARDPTKPCSNPGGEPDPKYLAMASKIACYYQQQCHAVVGYQQHRCQAWVDTHRQKYQEAIHAAMLVVAWYVRDRIQRRRARQKRRFKRGLREKQSTPTITARRQSVRRWITGVPKDSPPPTEPALERFADQEEANFSMDNGPSTPDKDSQLFDVADSLIRSQPAKIDIPLMGLLSFDESDSDSDSDSEDGWENNSRDTWYEGSEGSADDGEDNMMGENEHHDHADDLEDGEIAVSSEVVPPATKPARG